MMCWRVHGIESQLLHTSEFKVREVGFANCTKVRVKLALGNRDSR